MQFSVSRFSALIVCLLAMTILIPFAFLSPWLWAPAAIAVLLVLLGARDLVQSKHAIQRNYPILGHIRWFVELIRPELRQYLFEADEEAAPFSRCAAHAGVPPRQGPVRRSRLRHPAGCLSRRL